MSFCGSLDVPPPNLQPASLCPNFLLLQNSSTIYTA
jgi:hypothetical protein